jgi:hypothetical protein
MKEVFEHLIGLVYTMIMQIVKNFFCENKLDSVYSEIYGVSRSYILT